VEGGSDTLPPPSTLHPPSSPQTFACERCLRPRRLSRCDPNGWNELITHLTGGLLFGREVQRPDWFPRPRRGHPQPPDAAPQADPSIRNPQSQIRNRKIPYTPRPTRSPSVRRPQVERLLLAGRTFKQIAAELRLAYGTILWTAQQVYKQHGVRSLRDFLARHGQPQTPSTRDVRSLLLGGFSIPEIAAWKTVIYNQRQALRKAGKKLPDARVYNGGRRSRHDRQSVSPTPRRPTASTAAVTSARVSPCPKLPTKVARS
jgi:hypothetical protein